MPNLRALLVLALAAVASAEAQTPTTPSNALEGVWSQVEAFGPNTPWHATQPGQRIFVDGYYSTIEITTPNGAPRPLLPAETGTAAQVRASLGPISANAGTYSVSGNTFTETVVVAKNPSIMAPGNVRNYNYRIAGDSLWVTIATNPAGPVARPATAKYVRLRAVDQGGLRGVWRQEEVRPVNNPDTVTFNQPGFRIFADGYYHWIRVNGTAVRPPLTAESSAAELRAVWLAFTATAGRYGMAGNVNIQVPMITMNPAGVAPGNFITFTTRIAGDTLWSTNHGSQTGPVAPGGGSTGRYLRLRNRPTPTN